MKILKAVSLITLFLGFSNTPLLSQDVLYMPSKLVNLSIESKFEKNFYIYDFYLKNDSNIDITSIQYGTDCKRLTIPREYAPIEIIHKNKRSYLQNIVTSPFASKDWTVTILDSEDQSSPEIGFSVQRKASSTNKLLKGELKVFQIISKENKDSAYFNQPFCILAPEQNYFGVGRDKEWSAADDKLDPVQVEVACKSKAKPRLDGVAFNSSASGVCSQKKEEFLSTTALLEDNCKNQSALEMRQKNIDLNKRVSVLINEVNNNPSNNSLKSKLVKLKIEIANQLNNKLTSSKSDFSSLEGTRNTLMDILTRTCDRKGTP